MNVIKGNQASGTALVVGDFDNINWVELCDTRITNAAYDDAGYNAWVFNATGLAFIAMGAGNFTKLAMESGQAIDDTEEGGNGFIIFECYYADRAGTTEDPKLVIDWTPPGATPISVSDSGSGADADPSITAKLTIAESGSGADASFGSSTVLLVL